MSNKTDNQKVLQSLEPVSDDTATINGAGIDWSGFNECLGVVAFGVFAATATASVFLEESDAADFGSGVVVLDSIADVAVAGDQASHLLHAKRQASSKKYIRCRRTSGGTGDALVGADLVLMQPKEAPVS